MTESLCVFGDSIAHGMGARGHSYGRLVAGRLETDLQDFSNVAMQVSESLDALIHSPIQPTVALVAHGITEAIPRPTPSMLRLMPPRWRRSGWMDPRPYYSTALPKRVMQKLESSIRWRTRNLLLRANGQHTVMSLADYRSCLLGLVQELRRRGARVIVVGPPDIDDRFFPGATASERLYESAGMTLGVENLSLAGLLDRTEDYLADGFHPNSRGHEKIADAICRRLLETRGPAGQRP